MSERLTRQGVRDLDGPRNGRRQPAARPWWTLPDQVLGATRRDRVVAATEAESCPMTTTSSHDFECRE